jgi:shikimate dehydrogenase
MNRPDKPSEPYKIKKTQIFAVAGNPVLHSMSPGMFNAAFKACALDAVYIRIAASKAKEVIEITRDLAIAGINITSPFKEGIVQFLDDLDDSAKRTGAANTVVLRNGRYWGYNTDIAGVANAFLAGDVRLSGRKAAVIGAGGAAKAAVLALLSGGVEVVVFNRTFEKARSLAEASGCKASALELINEELEGVDILVQCLPVNARIVDPILLRKGLVVLDATYSVETPLVKDAKKRGCRVINGKEWLLFQGAQAFKHFTGIEPPLNVMRKALYKRKTVHKRNIALVGFMGAGKSTVASGISGRTGMPLVDIDAEIARKAGLSVEGIFESKGEHVFRKMEKMEIRDITNISGRVISCGGGVVLNGRNVTTLKRNCVVVWLWANINTVLKRVGSTGGRPLLNRMPGKSGIKLILKARLPLYARVSDLLVKTDGEEPGEIVRRIVGETYMFFKD